MTAGSTQLVAKCFELDTAYFSDIIRIERYSGMKKLIGIVWVVGCALFVVGGFSDIEPVFIVGVVLLGVALLLSIITGIIRRGE